MISEECTLGYVKSVALENYVRLGTVMHCTFDKKGVIRDACIVRD